MRRGLLWSMAALPSSCFLFFSGYVLTLAPLSYKQPIPDHPGSRQALAQALRTRSAGSSVLMLSLACRGVPGHYGINMASSFFRRRIFFPSSRYELECSVSGRDLADLFLLGEHYF